MDDVQIVKLLRHALAVLSDRLLTLVALCMTFALSCWVMRDPDWLRESMAAFFALCVFVPCIIKERVKAHEQTQTGET
jgi:uncharacterized membrane protein